MWKFTGRRNAVLYTLWRTSRKKLIESEPKEEKEPLDKPEEKPKEKDVPEEKVCAQCGNKLEEWNCFCTKCGAPVDAE